MSEITGFVSRIKTFSNPYWKRIALLMGQRHKNNFNIWQGRSGVLIGEQAEIIGDGGCGFAFDGKLGHNEKFVCREFEEKGAFTKRPSGEYCFAFWDDKKHILQLGRDEKSELPLFYTQRNGVIIFSTKLMAIYEYPGAENSKNLSCVPCGVDLFYNESGISLIKYAHLPD